ncbi:hypothetical protein IWT140_01047 [Secundilactobacillus pentosiphilus]|uniref:Uncharacterized protein n=1 Tax=Secundilactobacillus pentosiphilus TaxID=1714682 RepID=A0A1Z5INV5_9LACO|nr:hypothetical protein [Secundilactobacillus pentosiphilus]GAX03444.1 hypothetical protein IWT140_01047 [Secundilactobacillus pentosiphilus]
MLKCLISRFKKADQAADPDEAGAQLIVDLLLANRPLMEMVRWARAEEEISAYLSRDISRVSAIEGSDAPLKGVMIDLLARMYIGFADL